MSRAPPSPVPGAGEDPFGMGMDFDFDTADFSGLDGQGSVGGWSEGGGGGGYAVGGPGLPPVPPVPYGYGYDGHPFAGRAREAAAPGPDGEPGAFHRKRDRSSGASFGLDRDRLSSSFSYGSDCTPTDGASVWMTLDGLNPDAPPGSTRWCYAPVRSTFPLVALGRAELEMPFRLALAGSGVAVEYLPLPPSSPFAPCLSATSPQWELLYGQDAASGLRGFWLRVLPDAAASAPTHFRKASSPVTTPCLPSFPAPLTRPIVCVWTVCECGEGRGRPRRACSSGGGPVCHLGRSCSDPFSANVPRLRATFPAFP